MYSVNKVILIGNAGADPDIRTMPSGSRYARFSLATTETWRDKQDGERRDKTEWHRISVFQENLVQVIERYVKKGSKVYLQGRIETRKWRDESGQDRFTTEVVLKGYQCELVILDRPDRGSAEAAEEKLVTEEKPMIERREPEIKPFPVVGEEESLKWQQRSKDYDDLEDDIPF